jgi:hypothetical protein
LALHVVQTEEKKPHSSVVTVYNMEAVLYNFALGSTKAFNYILIEKKQKHWRKMEARAPCILAHLFPAKRHEAVPWGGGGQKGRAVDSFRRRNSQKRRSSFHVVKNDASFLGLNLSFDNSGFWMRTAVLKRRERWWCWWTLVNNCQAQKTHSPITKKDTAK